MAARSPAASASEQLIELCLLAGHYAMLAGLLNSAEVEREAGVGGFDTP